MEIQQVLAAKKIGLRTRQAASIQGMFILDNINPLALNILAVSMSLQSQLVAPMLGGGAASSIG